MKRLIKSIFYCLTVLFGFLTFIGCNKSDGPKKEYYSSGKLKAIYYKNNGVRVGNYYHFYESGVVDSISIPSGSQFINICFNPDGSRKDKHPLVLLDHIDTIKRGKYIPVISRVYLFNKIKTIENLSLLDSNGNVIWHSLTVDSCSKPSCETAFIFKNVIIDTPGRHCYVSEIKYADAGTGTMLIVDTQQINFYVR